MRTVLTLLALAATAPGCREAAPRSEPALGRPSDGLLHDVELQHVVALQIQRDAHGLVTLLDDPRPEVRARAAFALGSVQSPDAVPALVSALSDGDPAVRRDAAFALGQSGTSEAAEDLLARLDTEADTAVRAALIDAVSKLPSSAASAALAGLAGPAAEAPRVALGVARMGAVGGVLVPEALERLLEGLESADPGVRWGSAYFFGRLPQARPWQDRASRVRRALEGYDTGDPAARQLIAALGHLQDPADTPLLTRWARRARDWRTRANVMVALQGRELDDRGRELLFKALDDPSIHVARTAAEALTGSLQPLTAVHRMEEWIDAHPDRLPVIRPLMAFLASMDEREYVFAWLDGLPADDEARWDVGLAALASMSGEEPVARLERVVEGGTPALRRAAARALARLTGSEVAPQAGDTASMRSDTLDYGFDPEVIDWEYLRKLGPSPRWILETERGTVVLRLATEDAPQTVQAIARMADEGRFDGSPFHRVVPNFVVQGGDFAHRDGSGGPGFSIRSEFTEIPFRRGVVGMASAGKDTEGSQFFLNHTRTPHLDGRYTAFGWVVEGQEVVDRIQQGDRLLRSHVEPTP